MCGKASSLPESTRRRRRRATSVLHPYNSMATPLDHFRGFWWFAGQTEVLCDMNVCYSAYSYVTIKCLHMFDVLICLFQLFIAVCLPMDS